MEIYRLLYRSVASMDGGPAEIDAKVLAIIRRSEVENTKAGLTGALLFASGVFIQALEGPLEAVETTFERICSDLRHNQVQLIDFAAADHRAFEEWSMAAVAPAGELIRLCATLEAVEGARVDTANAAAIVQLMRTLVMTGEQIAAVKTLGTLTAA